MNDVHQLYSGTSTYMASVPADLDGGDAAPLLPRPRVRALDRSPSKATILVENSNLDLKTYIHELGRLISLAAPLVLSAMSGFLIPMISVAYIGHLGKYELSVVVLATSFFNVTGLSFIVGSLGALETLCGQAYGMQQYRQVGVALQRATGFSVLLAGGVAVMWTQMERIMLALGQDPGLAAASARYLQWTSPSLFFLTGAECLKRYLMAQSVILPATVAAIAAALVAVVFNYFFIFKFGMGLVGAAIASNIAQAAPLLVLVAWTVVREARMRAAGDAERTWFGWSREALSEWGEYCRLAAPSAAMVCLEWWSFEACVLMAGWLADPELGVSVMGLTLNVSGMLYMIPLGVGCATSVRVANALGAGLPYGARRAALVATSAVLALQCALAVGVVVARHVAGYIFTEDENLVVAAAPIFPLMAWCMLGDGLNAVIGGMLRGAGRQELGAALNLGELVTIRTRMNEIMLIID